VTVVSDLEGARVLYVADDRKRASLEAFWALGLTDTQRTALEAIAMDMWTPYVDATRAQVPDADAKIVFDRFHCAKHLNEGVDRVRRAEQRELRAPHTQAGRTHFLWSRCRTSGAVESRSRSIDLHNSRRTVWRSQIVLEHFGRALHQRTVLTAHCGLG
jgi:transposase